MSTIEKIAAGMFLLIGVFVIFTVGKDKNAFNTIVGSLGGAVSQTTRTLQGRS